MTYKKEFVAAIQINGKTLEEFDEVVYLPFNSEYQIYLKNKSNRKALVDIEIDGRNITGGGLIIPHCVDENVVILERFLDSGNLESGYKLKFIEKTDEIRDYRGDKPEDGLIRIEYRFEKRKKDPEISIYPPYLKGKNPWFSSGSDNVVFSSVSSPTRSMNCCYATSIGETDDGITVEGSDSKQGFKYASIGELEEESNLIFFKLMGIRDEKKISVPITTRIRFKCKYCGNVWDSSHKFCGKCGARIID